jgi:3-oxoacyl-[acyl-carrier protein] reductase
MTRAAIITGGTKGLGREISIAFARSGYFVLALYHSDDAGAAEFQSMLELDGLAGCCLRHDVCNADPSFLDLPAIRDAGDLVFIHNACPSFVPEAFHHLGWEDFQEQLDVAIKGAWQSFRPLLRVMAARKSGAFVSILSQAIEDVAPKGFAAYTTAKHALRGMTLALGAELGQYGIKSFSVSPGFMDTSLTRKWDARLRDMILTGAGRVTDPASAASRIVELTHAAETPGRGENYPL